MLAAEAKKKIFKQYGGNEKNTGSTEAQIALFTARINSMTEHMQKTKNDNVTERSLVRLVGKRRSLLNYLQDSNLESYRKLIQELDIRK